MRTGLLLLTIAISCAGCQYPRDRVTSHYATLAEARADALFDRGWLPDILPTSAHRIRTSNDLDHNTSTGEFSFTPSQSRQLYDQLTRGAPDRPGLVDWPKTVADYARRDYSAWSYRKGKHIWAFFCTAARDRCEYFLW